MPEKVKQNLGCPRYGYKGKGYQGQVCIGHFHDQDIANDIQALWYCKENITDILKKPATLLELFTYRKMWEIELKKNQEEQ